MKSLGKRLEAGSHVRVIAPARSLSLISSERVDIATSKLRKMGIQVSFGEHVGETDDFLSSTVTSRVADLNDAFSDLSVDGILTVIGGYNSIQLLKEIDYSLISRNPKILCGYSDITTLSNAIYKKTGLVGYSGPHFSSFSMIKGFDYTEQYFRKCLFGSDAYNVLPAACWSDDEWYLDQENRNFISNEGPWVINRIEGQFNGTIVGGNLGCFAVLCGTEFMPSLKNSILFLEEDAEINLQRFDRQLVSIINQPDFDGVKAILLGRFMKKGNVTRDILSKVIRSKPELKNIPVIANLDFGHTTPIFCFPIGGEVEVSLGVAGFNMTIIQH